MARIDPLLRLPAALRAAGLCALSWPVAQACAQASAEPAATERVTIASPRATAEVSGFGDLPLSRLPLQAGVTTAEQFKDEGIRRTSDLAKIDASVGDGYNAEGYYDIITVRGFALDNRFNYRREGLPISAETSIPLDNKSRLEVLKGINGLQAGVGSPGGLVNYVVRRPTAAPVREAFFGWQQNGSVLASVDLGQRFGEQQQFGARLNAAYEHIDTPVNVDTGYRYLAALALDWRPAAGTLLEAEIEVSRRSQPSVPGFSVLGSVVPAPGNPNINLNNQAWSQPSVFDATTGTLRWTQRLADDWQFVALGGSQRLATDDRTAFPFGCGTEGVYDRFCSNGTYDLYDYRSEGEQRRTNALDLSLAGRFATGPVQHLLTLGVQLARATTEAQPFAFNYAGIGNVEGTLMVPPAPEPTAPGSNRSASTSDLYLRDALQFGAHDTLWLGLRYTRQSTRTWLSDGTDTGSAMQSFASPWVAYSHTFDAGWMLYASWGSGWESDIVPDNPIYTNRGQALDNLQSRQTEIGVKGQLAQGGWSLAAFDIDRPVSADAGSCDGPDTCQRVRDGSQHHRGIEATIDARFGALSLAGGALALQARREGSADAHLNGLRPTNVPAYTLKLQAGWRVEQVPGLELLAIGLYESNRIVVPDNSLSAPGCGRLDLGLRYEQPLQRGALVWRAGVSNVFDERAWRATPFQFAHSYLFPLPGRAFTLSVQASL